MTCVLLEACVADQGRGMEEGGSDHGHNRVSTYARITITTLYQRGMITVLCYCSRVVRASIKVWLS